MGPIAAEKIGKPAPRFSGRQPVHWQKSILITSVVWCIAVVDVVSADGMADVNTIEYISVPWMSLGANSYGADGSIFVCPEGMEVRMQCPVQGCADCAVERLATLQ
jgi:hypothetical protein